MFIFKSIQAIPYKKQSILAHEVQAARTLSMSLKWWYDIISLNTRPSHAAYMRVNARSIQGLMVKL